MGGLFRKGNMDSIRIDGVKRIAINDDPTRVIEFNPGDVTFVERFYRLIQDFESKQADYQARAEEIDRSNQVGEDGVPVNVQDRLAFMREVCSYMREKIDYLFGAGTSQMVFGDAFSLEMIGQLFDGLTPFIQQARREKLVKYTSGKKRGRVMR